MSDIFKIFHIDDKNIKKVYVFKGNNEEEVFSKSELSEIQQKGIEVIFSKVKNSNHFFKDNEKKLRNEMEKYIKEKTALI